MRIYLAAHDTPREEMRRELVAEIDAEFGRRGVLAATESAVAS